MLKKKSLGQHFLNNPYYLGLVADAAHIKKGDVVVEIGPGEGSLTSFLLDRGAKVIALEKDHRLIKLLQEKFKDENFKIIEGDALDFDSVKLKKFKVVGNIPYYITGALLKKFLTDKAQPTTLVFLMQKEVAERIARSKKESILSLSVKAYGEPQVVAKVPRGAFNPPPTVDSAILCVQNVSRNNFKNKKHEQKFFDAVKRGFAQKRKKLSSNLGKDYSSILTDMGMSENTRAEDVELEQWLEISKH